MNLSITTARSAFQRRPCNEGPSPRACIACRARHQKCNASIPICRRCQASGSECIYKESKRGVKRQKRSPAASKDYHEGDGEGKPPGRVSIATPIAASSPKRLEKSSLLAVADVNPDMNETALSMENLPGEATSIRPSIDSEQVHQNGTPDILSEIGNSMLTNAIQDTELTQSYHDGIDGLLAEKASKIPYHGAECETDTLIELYFTKFNNGHPFLIPRSLYRTKPSLLPLHLKAVMRFVASHFMPGFSPETLRKAAENITSDHIPKDGYQVQGLMLFGMSLYARFEQELAMACINQAIDLALDLGMSYHRFALKHGMGNPIIEESWRRTWWDLYMIDGILATLNSAQHPFRLQDVQTDMPLPCEEFDYAQCKDMPRLRTQSDFLERAFAAETYVYSSMAYKIEAVRLAGNVLRLGTDMIAPSDAQVEGVDASLANFLLSLPQDKRHIIERDGQVDEVLFSAHSISNCALIMLHRPRSNLVFIKDHYPTPCTRREANGLPVSAYEIHTSKAIKAANAISNAIAVQTPLAKHSPCFVCAIVLAAIVHLPAYSMEMNKDKSSAIKERLQLTVSALNSIGETWPMAKAVKMQISQFAREIFSNHAMAAGPSSANVQVQETDIGSMMDDETWLDELSYLGPNESTMLLENVSTEPIFMANNVPVLDTS
ncbi:MAG: hypothetical protein M1827_007188 [Pycnora praestabilis]|nr:MAG: hypothetical protein M1827_007188 [Pycnora praestabilis]